MSFGHSSETANVTAGPMSLSALSTEPMLYKTLSAAVYGIDASIIEVEVDISGVRLPKITFTLSVCPTRPCAKAEIACAQR